MSRLTRVILHKGKESSLLRFHPWVFSGAIKKILGTPEEGDIVEVVSSDKEFLALGHYQIGSIAIRILSFAEIEINHDFWVRQISNAYKHRLDIGVAGTTANNIYRLIHGEGDNLPVLIIDIYDKTAVFQAHSVGMWKNRYDIAKAVTEVLGNSITSVYNKSEGSLPFKADLHEENGFLIGNNKEEEFAIENNLKFKIDWLRGQKTGFFVDQRENRLLLKKLSEGKKVLNMFCYTGGFSVYALDGNAELVHSVDSSARAIDLTNKNIELNFGNDNRHKSFAVDAFKFLNEAEQKYDMIILDPPAFAKHKNVLNNALQGYRKLNAKAIEAIEPGGIIFTFSCSQVVTRDIFRTTIFSAAAQTKRKVRILYQLTQPSDHPVNIYHPEGEYLKGLVIRVD